VIKTTEIREMKNKDTAGNIRFGKIAAVPPITLNTKRLPKVWKDKELFADKL